jgi:hypothetical protein
MTKSTSSAQDVVSEVFNYIIAQGDADYIGELVSQLEHPSTSNKIK